MKMQKETNYNIVIYSDRKYMDNAIAMFNNVAKFPRVRNVYYFTVGFNFSEVSEFSHPKLFPIEIDFNPEYRNMILFKPFIIRESLKLPGESFIYMDTDILVSNRFREFEWRETEFPVSPWHQWECPQHWDNGKLYTEDYLMEHLKVEKRISHYVQACVIVYGRNHKSFIEEWMKICKDSELNGTEELRLKYMYSDDETVYNVLLWKKGNLTSMGPVCVSANYTNHTWEETVKRGESSEPIEFAVYNTNTSYFRQEDLLFYHGIKKLEDLENLETILNGKTKR